MSGKKKNEFPVAVMAGVARKTRRRQVTVDQETQELAAKMYKEGVSARKIASELGMQLWEVEYSVVDHTPRPKYKKKYICPGCRNVIEIDPCLICYVRRQQ